MVLLELQANVLNPPNDGGAITPTEPPPPHGGHSFRRPAIGAQPGFTGQGPEVGHGMAVGPHVGIDQLSLHALPATWEVVWSKKGCELDVGKVGDWRYWDIRWENSRAI